MIRFGNWLSGFTAGEGCFHLGCFLHQGYWRRGGKFKISLNKADLPILERIKSFLGCGRLSISSDQMASFTVGKASDLASVLVPFFETYPLRAKKEKDFNIWKQGVDLLFRSQNRTWSVPNHNRFVDLVAKCGEAKKYRSQTESPDFPVFDDDGFGDWVAGLIDGEGHLSLRAREVDNRNYMAGISITLRKDDLPILCSIKSKLGCGSIRVTDRKGRSKPSAEFRVHNVNDLADKVVPFLERHPMQSRKSREFPVWRDGVLLLKEVKNREIRSNGLKFFSKWEPNEPERFHHLREDLLSLRRYA